MAITESSRLRVAAACLALVLPMLSGEFGGSARAQELPSPEGASPAPSSGPNQDPAPPPADEANRSEATFHPYGFHQIKLDARYLFTRPLHLDSQGWLKVAATFGTAAILYIDRQAIRNSVQERRSEAGDNFLQKPRTMGKGAFAPSLALISYGSFFLTHDDREKETAVLLMESMAFTGAVVGLGQFVLSSERPDEGSAVHFFQWGGHGVSGDAALAASVVPVLKNQYLRVRAGDGGGLRLWKRSATGLLYAGALLTGYQRVYSDKHWAPDAFLGLVSGFTVGQILCDSHDAAREATKSRAAVTAFPGGFGVKWTF